MTTEPETEMTAGQILKIARERRKLTVQQVAVQLNLKAEQVERLEQDQLDNSMPETFAKGYLRAYARLLKLPEAQIMSAFVKQTGSTGPAAKPMRTFSNRTGRQATENRFVWLTYAIVALLLLLLFVWWWQMAREPIITSIPQSEPAAMTQSIESDTPEQPASNNNVASPEQSEPTEAAQMDQLLEQLQQQPEQDVAAEEPIAADIDTLEMRFSDNCWVDVVDADGNRVAYGTKQAGYIMELTGKAPFTVTLGNPGRVNIVFNQQPVDLSALPPGRVAKFTIPEQE